MDSPSACVARFHRRGGDGATDPWHEQVRAIVAGQGGDEVLRRSHAALESVLARRPEAVVVASPEGDVDQTYRSLLATL